MKKKVTLIVLALGLAMLFAAVTPVFACPLKCFSFTAGQVAVSNPNVPGKIILTTNYEFAIGAGSINYQYTSAFGYEVASEKDWSYFNTNPSSTAYLTGSLVGTVTSSVSKEEVMGTFNGLGLWTYTAHYTAGPLAGENAMETWEGVSFIDGSGIYSATVNVH